MRLPIFALLLLALPFATHADEPTPYGWDQCTTAFAGDVEGCLEYVSGSCTSEDREACLSKHAKEWFAFGATRSLTQAMAPASTGKRIDLTILGNAATTAGNFTGDCTDDDVDCMFNTVVRNVLKEHGPEGETQ